jgi:tRNA dimethylallyltransferase
MSESPALSVPSGRLLPLVALVGPTGVGKTRYAARLARLFAGEIINADSRQVYRGMDIGTAKPDPEELACVPHHLFDLISPSEDFNLPAFVHLARQKISEIHARGRLPFLVGGSGQYVWGLLEGWQVPSVAPNADLRRELEELASREGPELLYSRLQATDAEAARNIDSRNVRRIIRALEVTRLTGQPFSQMRRKQNPPYHVLLIGLTAARKALYARTDARIEKMFSAGWLSEVKSLLDSGYNLDLSAMNSIGYREVGEVLDGHLNLEEAKERIKTATHRLVRHQYSWFRLRDPRIRWFDTTTDVLPEMLSLLDGFFNSAPA